MSENQPSSSRAWFHLRGVGVDLPVRECQRQLCSSIALHIIYLVRAHHLQGCGHQETTL